MILSLGLTRTLRHARRDARRGLHVLHRLMDRGRQGGVAAVIGEAARYAGHALRRTRPDRALDESMPPAGAAFDVIYAIGYWSGEPKRYRVFNAADGLRRNGYAVHVMPFDRLDDLIRHRWTAAVLVLFRAEYDPHGSTDRVAFYVRSGGGRVVYDVDDFVFDEAMACWMDGLRLMGPYERAQQVRAMERRRRLLLACDLTTFSTVPLARAVTALGRPAAVIPNALNRQQLDTASDIAVSDPRPDGRVRLGYFSGSRTHQRDFASCERALLTVMARQPRLVLRIGGYLDLGPQWQPFRERIERCGFLEPAELLRCMAACNINLAPLELANPFCEAKSELKFFEAAVVGVPTIASATETFAGAIENGVSGLVVKDENEWLRALELLALSPDARRTMGEAARRTAIARYSPSAVNPQIITALGLSALRSQQPQYEALEQDRLPNPSRASQCVHGAV
jgi:glycosyltransferase involved in cell wall biosynthesis